MGGGGGVGGVDTIFMLLTMRSYDFDELLCYHQSFWCDFVEWITNSGYDRLQNNQNETS